MGQVIFFVVAANLLLFAGLSIGALRYARTADYPRLRLIADALAVVSFAFVLGAATRLVSLGVQLGWFSESLSPFLLSEWHLIQSLFAMGLGIAGLLVIRGLSRHLEGAERIAEAVSDQLLTGTDVDTLGLTKREIEVCHTLAEGNLSDAAISQLLYISPATAATHVKHILKKTGLRNRRELALLFATVER